jgi:hypothetical protein
LSLRRYSFIHLTTVSAQFPLKPHNPQIRTNAQHRKAKNLAKYTCHMSLAEQSGKKTATC